MIPASPHVATMVERTRDSGRSALEQGESLVELAMDLQQQPKAAQDLIDAVYLYEHAAALTLEFPLARARAVAGRGAALRRMPGSGLEELQLARQAFEEALPILREQGDPEEAAEAEMSYGLILQTLASVHHANLVEAVQAYQRALRFFGRENHPREYAILHNNLATAYLSMKLAPEREVMREALAVQSFREALRVVTLDEDPIEYSMLQNNLGNALQAMRSSHPLENLARAVEAYDEALKVRTLHDMPVEHANTLANKANALMNLPDDPSQLEAGNPKNLRESARLLRTAQGIFMGHQLADRAGMLSELIDSIERDLLHEVRA